MRIGYEVGGLMVALWGKNLTKKDYRTYARVFAAGSGFHGWSPPRTHAT